MALLDVVRKLWGKNYPFILNTSKMLRFVMTFLVTSLAELTVLIVRPIGVGGTPSVERVLGILKSYNTTNHIWFKNITNSNTLAVILNTGAWFYVYKDAGGLEIYEDSLHKVVKLVKC